MFLYVMKWIQSSIQIALLNSVCISFDYSSLCTSFQEERTRDAEFLFYCLTKANEKYESPFFFNLMKSIISEKRHLCSILNNLLWLESSSLNFLRIGTNLFSFTEWLLCYWHFYKTGSFRNDYFKNSTWSNCSSETCHNFKSFN